MKIRYEEKKTIKVNNIILTEAEARKLAKQLTEAVDSEDKNLRTVKLSDCSITIDDLMG